jgi:hypothetical protein
LPAMPRCSHAGPWQQSMTLSPPLVVKIPNWWQTSLSASRAEALKVHRGHLDQSHPDANRPAEWRAECGTPGEFVRHAYSLKRIPATRLCAKRNCFPRRHVL